MRAIGDGKAAGGLHGAEVALATPNAEGIASAQGVFDLASPLSERWGIGTVAPLLVEHPVVDHAEAHPLIVVGLAEEARGDEGLRLALGRGRRSTRPSTS